MSNERHPLIDRVIELQTAEGITGSEVARRLNIDPSSWHRLTYGTMQPSIRVVRAISRAYPVLTSHCVQVLLIGNESSPEQDNEPVAAVG